jgi:beta-lactamase superfamily II metal-dependent hydrolase
MFALFVFLVCSLAHAGDVVVDMLDIGQGDSILIRTPAKKAILIDAGDRGDDVVEKLAALGVDHLDLIVATHPHADHIGSMEQVVRTFPPKVYIDNGLPHTTTTYSSLMATIEANPAISYKAATKGMVFNLDDGAKLEVLLPSAPAFHDTRSDLNANSVVTRLTHGEDCFLFVGDSEEPTERRMIDDKVGQCDVLKVAHHGSRHSTIQPFLDMVHPKVALISVGQGNRYHHPGEETLARLEAAHVTVYRTDRDGRITATSTGHSVEIATEKHEGAAAALLPVTGVPGNPKAAPPPPPEDPDMAPDVVDDEACPFAASKSSEVFHKGGCGNAAKINPENLVCYASRDAAIKAGKRPAGCCHP